MTTITTINIIEFETFTFNFLEQFVDYALFGFKCYINSLSIYNIFCCWSLQSDCCFLVTSCECFVWCVGHVVYTTEHQMYENMYAV